MTDDAIPPDEAAVMALTAPVATLAAPVATHPPITHPAGVLMPPTRHRGAARRNAKAKPKRAPTRYRNAGPTPPLRPSLARAKEPPPPSKKETFINLVETLIGAGATSLAGAYAVRWGLHPDLVSVGLGAIGGYAAVQSAKERSRHVAAGAASAAGSQLVLRVLNPPKPAAAPAAPAHAPPPQTTQNQPPAGLRKADLGALPPGMLDAAFERARSELAVAGDGYPAGYEHHQFHHGPVMP
jgi:hypothetical protein